jgi:hypothetical protein
MVQKKGAFTMRIFPGFQHGVNLGGWLSQCVATTDAHFNTFIGEADIERFAAITRVFFKEAQVL